MGTHNEKFILVHGYANSEAVVNAHHIAFNLFPELTSDIITFNGRSQFFVGSPGDKEGLEYDPENMRKRHILAEHCKYSTFQWGSMALGYLEIWDTEHSSWQMIRRSTDGEMWAVQNRNIFPQDEEEEVK